MNSKKYQKSSLSFSCGDSNPTRYFAYEEDLKQSVEVLLGRGQQLLSDDTVMASNNPFKPIKPT